jgi:uncharacterized protein
MTVCTCKFLIEQLRALTIPKMMMLQHEHDEDPEMRPDPISPEKREEVIVHMAAGLVQAYRYFRAQRRAGASAHRSEPPRNASKIGRNDPCPCGSGKKYKKCCGGAAGD